MTAPRVIVYPSDEGGTGFYRMIAPARALIDQGADVQLVLPSDPAEDQLQAQWEEPRYGGAPILRDVIAPDADVVVFQRCLQRKLAEQIPVLQAKGVRVVVDVDDDFEHISRRNVSWSSVNGSVGGRHKHWLAYACHHADLVTVSTPALAEVYGAHGRVAVLPNYVPARYLAIEHEPRDDVYVGWSGSVETHPLDLQVTRGGVAAALRATGALAAVIGTGRGVSAALGLVEPPVSCGWQSLENYPVALAQLDVGIVPLEMTPFNEAKSWLKGLEMAAVGVPFVASPTQQYRALAAAGAGWIATKPNEWEGMVKRLVRDVGFREDQAEAGRRAASLLTIESHAVEWLEAWETVVNTRGATSAA